ncbi:hypothetical protein RO3G_14317 [Rhizopus delemar RA 99-880]|uniref:Uncharacterized protein n=1 Tax=Rhizopus delemar (strain RA 99-880 / ATCC MYA-4621 / FGSC 9543 / NRRL 43880) TaxID=246409 RepID=I1CMC6_RHIO9|nr:hypothetical protein RO3G_14317 [Rhizopus delemar RA 99-880]|eukprot:EIE89606.1 hypothetical protein RO3G_14317 [Rhizopus delemar RA 99-880]
MLRYFIYDFYYQTEIFNTGTKKLNISEPKMLRDIKNVDCNTEFPCVTHIMGRSKFVILTFDRFNPAIKIQKEYENGQNYEN